MSPIVSTTFADPPTNHVGAAKCDHSLRVDNDINSAAPGGAIPKLTSKEPIMHPTLACDLAFLHVHGRLEGLRRAAGESRLCHAQVLHRPPRRQ